MVIGFRVDASRTIGTGHLTRCLALARALADHGAVVRFAVRKHDEVAEITLAEAFPVEWLDAGRKVPDESGAIASSHRDWVGTSWAQDARDTVSAFQQIAPDFVIVDHYGLDARWHAAVRTGLDCKLVAIDDLGDRPLSVDVLLDGNFSQDHSAKYRGRLLGRPRVLAGPRYAIISDAYRAAEKFVVRSDVSSVGVFMGGTDPDNASAKVLASLRSEAEFTGRIEIVSTSANANLPSLRQACEADPAVKLSLNLPNLAAFYARHDVQIGAGGTATYERCCIGSPTIAMVLAENQLAVVPGLTEMGVLRPARLQALSASGVLNDAPSLADAFHDLASDPETRRSMAESGMNLVDGRGAQRLAVCLLAENLALRDATMDDGLLLHAWRNHPTIRSKSATQAPIPLPSHMAWLERKLSAEDCRLYIASVGPTSVGTIRFDALPGGTFEVSLYLDPDLSQLGIGHHLLIEGERRLMRDRADATLIIASVLPGNVASERLFAACGYSGGPLQFEKHLRLEESES